MKQPFYLRLFMLLDCFLLVYPFLALCHMSAEGAFSASSVFELLFIAASGFLGFGIAWMILRFFSGASRVLSLLMGLLAVVPVVLTSRFLFPQGALSWWIALFSVVAYFAGFFLLDYEFTQIVRAGFLVFGTVSYVVAALILWFCQIYYGLQSNTVPLIVSFLLFILLYALLGNQSNLERLMGRRRYDLSMLPAGMRKYNILLISVGFVVILPILLFQKEVGWLLGFLLQLFGYLLSVFLILWKGFLWLVNSGLEEDQPLPEVASPNLFKLLQGESTEAAATPFINALIQWSVVLGLLLLLFFSRRHIWNAILFVWRGAVKCVKRLFQPRGKKTLQRQSLPSLYFSDTIEDLARPSSDAQTDSPKDLSLREWKRQYHAFLALPVNEKSFRKGYGLILQWLRLHSIPLTLADTTLEILNKALVRLPQCPFSQTTDGYNVIEYAMSPLRQGDYASLLATLKVLSAVK